MFQRIYIEITNICNLDCSFCVKNKRSPQIMSLIEFKHIIEQIQDHTQHIYLHVQGEPLLHPHLIEFMDIAYNAQLKVHLVTNGTLLAKYNDALYAHPALAQLSVSLHALQIEENDPNHTILKQMIKQSAHYHYSLFLRIWRFDDLSSRERLANLLDIQVQDLPLKRTKIGQNVTIDLDETFIWPSIDNPFVSNSGYCHSGSKLMAILVDGTVTPCCLDAEGIINLGNLHRTSFETILNTSKLKAISSAFNQNQCTEELCKHCTYRLRFNKKRGITL